jgi:pimeloyl-ACP methyl ester carboxylesterase
MGRAARALRRFAVGVAVVLVLLGAWLAWPRAPGPRLDAVAELRAREGLDVEERWIEINGVRLHVVLAGPESELARRSPEHGTNIRTVELPDASHWVLHEQPARATELLLEFLTEP